jgi:hypothetical protein
MAQTIVEKIFSPFFRIDGLKVEVPRRKQFFRFGTRASTLAIIKTDCHIATPYFGFRTLSILAMALRWLHPPFFNVVQ